MTIRLKEAVENFEYEELLKMQKDLELGGVHLKKLIDIKVKEKQKVHDESCSVCMNAIDPQSHDSYTLVFGPHDFRKKATFDAIDCMEYFIKNLKKQKAQIREAQQP